MCVQGMHACVCAGRQVQNDAMPGMYGMCALQKACACRHRQQGRQASLVYGGEMKKFEHVVRERRMESF